jgi:hypothetical protein
MRDEYDFSKGKPNPYAARLKLSGTAMKAALIRSIEDRRTISFLYNGKRRVAEPQCYGLGTSGTELLRAFQVHEDVNKEALFDVAKIDDLLVLERHFDHPGPHYKRNDSAMCEIFAQL